MKSEKKTIYIHTISQEAQQAKGPFTSIQVTNAFRPSAIFVEVQNSVPLMTLPSNASNFINGQVNGEESDVTMCSVTMKDW
jgi:hypothetical protein